MIIDNSTMQDPTGLSNWTNPILMTIIIIAIIVIIKLILSFYPSAEFDKTEEVAGYGK